LNFIEPKKPFHLMWSGFFDVVDLRIELPNHFHIDLVTVDLQLEEERRCP
jgi:hypothetical protein